MAITKNCTPKRPPPFSLLSLPDDPTLSILALLDRLQRTHGVCQYRRTVERIVGRGPRKNAAGRRASCWCGVHTSTRDGFHVAGDPAQAEYERRRAAFLDWDNRQGSAPTPPRSAVLDLAGLAGILTRSAAEWTVHCVVASQ